MKNLINKALQIPQSLVEEWQEIVNIMAEIIEVPAGLIMRVSSEELEVFVASQTPGNPYTPGESEIWNGSGLYCETVINSREKLLVPDALSDPKWESNPDIRLNMISYLGYPIFLPNGEVFGTICVLDNKKMITLPFMSSL
ncbi:MAG: GAF domain-containing protein [Candidatus Marinimicrobia bacterium]|nr:GAF domain-containing protein [Candidatus Neomarinimicrobiota bacterium]